MSKVQNECFVQSETPGTNMSFFKNNNDAKALKILTLPKISNLLFVTSEKINKTIILLTVKNHPEQSLFKKLQKRREKND